MKKNLLLWKTIGKEQGNFEKLLTDEYFYWSKDSKFSSLNIGDYIFIVDRPSSTFLFASFAGDEGLEVTEIKEDNVTEVRDLDNEKVVTAGGTGWDEFIKFRILQKIKIESKDWLKEFSYQSTNGVLILYKEDEGRDGSNKFEPSKTVIKGDVPKKLLELELIEEAESALKDSIYYAESFSLPDQKEKISTAKKKEMKIEDPKKVLKHVHDYITSLGFRYHFEEIVNFYLSLRAKPFVILAGISGTGKTQLPKKFAEALGFLDSQVFHIAVSPDWTDDSDLIGYTALDGKFISKSLTFAIQKALKEPTKPFFFILDEMNLARVEHYFSNFLSVIETRKRKGDEILTDPLLKEEVFISKTEKILPFGWPQNLFLIGTVNMDETTHAFSRKVLDRANSIEMNDIDLNWIKNDGQKRESLENIPYSFFSTKYISSVELTLQDKEMISEEMKFLQEVNQILRKADLHFAYRVRDEIAFYLILNKKYNLIDSDTAIDFQIMQKILPRIHGSSERVQIVLVELLNLLETKDFRSSSFEFSMLKDKLDMSNLQYERATKKILFMLERFDEDRFTSFWL